MRWLEFKGTRYDLQEATQEASIRDVVYLKRQSGLTIPKIAKALTDLGQDMDSRESPIDALLAIWEDEEALLAFAAMLLLCRRKAGDLITWDEVQEASLYEIHLIWEQEEVEDDPKAPSQSTPAAESAETPTT